MEKFELKAEIREVSEKLNQLRSNKQVPGIVYGHHQEPINLKIDASTLLRTYRKAGESHIISLEVGKKKINVLIHELQKGPVSGDITHVDFYAITEGEKVHTRIHLIFVGDSEAKKLGAIIEEHVKELEVKCLSSDLVDSFEVDLSLLKDFGDTIKVSDLKIDSKKYDILTNADDLVAHAYKPSVVTETTAEEPKKEETTETK